MISVEIILQTSKITLVSLQRQVRPQQRNDESSSACLCWLGMRVFSWLRKRRENAGPTERLGRDVATGTGIRSPAVVFIHGLGSSPAATWQTLIDALSSDTDLSAFSFDCYHYPTAKFSVRSLQRVATLPELAKGLATEIRLRHSGRSELLIICHSLGGLVARQFALTEVIGEKISPVSRMLLLATPNTGAALAIAGKELFPDNSHVQALAPFSAALETLNDGWVKYAMDNQTTIQYVAGGADMIVSQPSAKGLPGRVLDDMLIGYDHKTITQVSQLTSTNYLLIKEFILRTDCSFSTAALPMTEKRVTSDPLFEIYRPDHEEFYLVRNLDTRLLKASRSGHIWLTGPSGVGKTAALQRRASLSGLDVTHIFLSSQENPNAKSLIRSICLEIAECVGYEGPPPEAGDLAEAVTYFRRLVRMKMRDGMHAILIEEIPLKLGPDYSEFLGYIEKLILALESEPNSDVVLFFSSIVDPAPDTSASLAKFRSRVQFVPMSYWTSDETSALVRLITGSSEFCHMTFTHEDISISSNGRPRLIKSFFHRVRNSAEASTDFSKILQSVLSEQV